MGKVIVQDYTYKKPITMIGVEAGICWGANTSNDEKNYLRGIDCLESGHGRTFEFPDVYLTLEGYSARVIREWYTHIGGLPTRLQASTRYIDYEHGFGYVTPPSIEGNPEAKEVYEDLMEHIKSYLESLDTIGVPREDSALGLPLGMETKIVCKHNMRKTIVAGNWKMNMLPNEAMRFIEELAPKIKNTKNEVILCVPYTDLFYSLLTTQDTNIKIGAQNMHWKENGAYTGEVSGKMLECIGVKYVIIGHSERRQYFAETDETVNLKIKSALANNLKPIVCVGETLQQREEGKTTEIIKNQIKQAFNDLTNEQVRNIIIAYEPIWAIGTGKTATAEDANNVIKSIRKQVEDLYGSDVAENIIIQYGGSVKSSNAKELFETSDIDGGLVGGASLVPEEFAKIVNYNK